MMGLLGVFRLKKVDAPFFAKSCILGVYNRGNL